MISMRQTFYLGTYYWVIVVIHDIASLHSSYSSRNLHSTNIFFCEVECNIIGSSSFISISVRNMPMCQRHTTLTNAYLSTISEHLSALYSKDLPFVTKLFNQRRNEIGITNLMFVRGRLKWDYRCFDIQSASITKCR